MTQCEEFVFLYYRNEQIAEDVILVERGLDPNGNVTDWEAEDPVEEPARKRKRRRLRPCDRLRVLDCGEKKKTDLTRLVENHWTADTG